MNKLKPFLSFAVLFVLSFLVSGCKNDDREIINTSADDSVSSLVVTAEATSLPAGLSIGLKAEVVYQSGRVEDVTNSSEFSWSTNDAALAEVVVDSEGRVVLLGKSSGVVDVTVAGLVDGLNLGSTLKLEVIEPVVIDTVLDFRSEFIPVGMSQQYSVYVYFSNGKYYELTDQLAVSWSTQDPEVASVSAGMVTALAMGSTEVEATFSFTGKLYRAVAGLSVTESVVTELIVTPVVEELSEGLQANFTASVLLSDGRVIDVTQSDVTSWSTSSENVAVVSNDKETKGIVTGIGKGDTYVLASGSFNDKYLTAKVPLTVTDAVVTNLRIDNDGETIPLGFVQQYTASVELSNGAVFDVTNDDSIDWRTSDPSIASVSNATNAKGLVTSYEVGDIEISVFGEFGGRKFNSSTNLSIGTAVVTSLAIEPRAVSIPAGLEHDFQVYANLSDGRAINITDDSSLYWHSTNPSVAKVNDVSGSGGSVLAISEGAASILVSLVIGDESFEAETSLKVTKAKVVGLTVELVTPSVPVGLEGQALAYAHLTDGSIVDVTSNSAIHWSVNNSTLAYVSGDQLSSGVIKTFGAGVVDVIASAELEGMEFKGVTSFEITNAIVTEMSVLPVLNPIPVGLTYNFEAQATLSDGRVIDVTGDSAINWKTSDPSIASISNAEGSEGSALGLAVDEVYVTATGFNNGKKFESSVLVSISDAVVVDLLLKCPNDTLPLGLEMECSVHAVMSDGSSSDVTQDDAIAWSSSNTDFASVTNLEPSRGKVKGQGVGQSLISVSGFSLSDSMSINVTDAVVVNLDVTPLNLSLPVGLDQPFSAFVRLSDGQILDVTGDESLAWKVSDSSVAAVSHYQGREGLVTALKPGAVDVIASGEANGVEFEAKVELIVTNAVVSTLSLSPDQQSLPVGHQLQYSAQVQMSDGTFIDVTMDEALHWRTSDSTQAVVSDLIGSKGVVTALKEGEVSVFVEGSANGTDFSAVASLLITKPTLEAISLTAKSVTLTEYHNVKVDALAHYSDGTIIDVTAQSSWYSGPNVSVVEGLVTASPFVEGSTSFIHATFDGMDSDPIVVTMQAAERTEVIGKETPYYNEISSDVVDVLSFKGSAVIDGIYDADTEQLLAGGYGGSLNASDRERYSDLMHIDDVTHIKGIYGTAWSRVPMLQVLEWYEGDVEKQVGKLYSGTPVEVGLDNSVLGIIVFSSAESVPRYVTGIQFVYK